MIKDEILDLLNNPNKIEKNDEKVKLYSEIVPVFENYYDGIKPEYKKEWIISAAAYVFGKACERTILKVIRPEIKRLWILIQEVNNGVSFNLPRHIEDALYPYLDACENACEEYIDSNLNFNVSDLLLNCQCIGDMISRKEEFYNLEAGGLKNDMIMTSDEMHAFGVEGLKRSLQNKGFEIVETFSSSSELYSIKAIKDKVEYYIAVGVSILPETSSLPSWKANHLYRLARSKNAKACFCGIGLQSKNDLYASMKLAVREGDYQIRISPLYEIQETGVKNLEE